MSGRPTRPGPGTRAGPGLPSGPGTAPRAAPPPGPPRRPRLPRLLAGLSDGRPVSLPGHERLHGPLPLRGHSGR